MTNELQTLGLFFLGVSVGSLNPSNSILGWLIPITIGTIFIVLDLYYEVKNKGD
jgi:hypothetical protein